VVSLVVDLSHNSGSPGKAEKTVCLSTKSENYHQTMIFADLLSESFGKFQKNSFRKFELVSESFG
jgi:hypothetical protein